MIASWLTLQPSNNGKSPATFLRVFNRVLCSRAYRITTTRHARAAIAIDKHVAVERPLPLALADYEHRH